MIKAECSCEDKTAPLVIYSRDHHQHRGRNRYSLVPLISLHPLRGFLFFNVTRKPKGCFDDVRGNWLVK